MSRIAHSLKEKSRTEDVVITENVDFSSLLLSKSVSQGLANSGFHKPSPIQLKAIPLGRCGLDLIVQAKSGTGKTCVFAVVSLETIQIDSPSTQVLVLAPTREIAVQIWEVINGIGSAISGLKCHTFIGGLPLQEDRMKLKKCHIAVGTPGRVKQLIETGVLKTESVRLFVLDEADKLLEESFQDQINWIYSSLPENKQMLALSATYPEYLADHLTAYMRNPTFLRLNISDPALLGIRQYYKTVPYHPMSHVVFEEKSKALTSILSSVSFQQCLVFSNLQTRAQNLADSLNHKGWPTACIAGCLDQKDRNHAMAKLKTYKCRILISTDLTARGIDADKVNVIINLDIPKDHETYLHRIGRAGRFGSFGIAVTLLSEGQERMDLDLIEKRCNTHINPLPDPIPEDLAHAGSPIHLDDLVSSEVINTDQAARNKTNNAERTINIVSKDGKKSGQDTGENGENNTVKSSHEVDADKTVSDINNSNNNNNSESHVDEFDGGCKSLGINGSEAMYSHVNGDITEPSSEVRTGQNMFIEKSDNQTILNKTSCSDDVTDSISDDSKMQTSTETNAGIVDFAENNDSWLNGHETDLINEEDNNVKYVAGSSSMDELSDSDGSNTDVGGEESIVECPGCQGKSDTTDLIRTSGADKIKTCISQQILSEMKDPELLAEVVVENSQVAQQTDDLDRFLFPSSDVATFDTLNRKPGSSVEQAYCNKDYSRFHLFKPPKIDLVSVFKQTIGHKDVKKPHTYETAKAELQSFYTDNTKRLGDKNQPVVMQNQCSKKTAEHEVLMFAVNELQVMFDRAGIAPNTVSDVNVGHTSSFPAAKENKMSLLENVPKTDHKEIQKSETFQSVPSQLLLEGSSRNEMKTPDNEQDMVDSVNVNLSMTTENVVLNDKSNDGVGDVNEGTAKLKPRKQNRRGYAGKFAIAHMLEQTSDKNEGNESRSKTLGNSDIFKDDCVIAKEKLNEGLTSNRADSDEVVSNFVKESLSKVDIADEETDSKDNYQELVFESQAVETLMKDDSVAQTQTAVKTKGERKVSFSSDEIVTEDSDSDSSSSEEEITSKTEAHLVDSYQTRINLSKQKENKHLSQVKRTGLELSSSSKKSDTEFARRQRRKEFEINGEAELSDGERETLEEARYTNHERNDETFPQHHPGYPGYPHYPPPGYPPPWLQFPTSHFNQWYPPNYMHFQHRPMQYQQYPYYAFPGPYWPYSVPYSNNDSSIDQSSSVRNENMKQAFEVQSDYIRSMCQKPDQRKKQKSKKKVRK